MLLRTLIRHPDLPPLARLGLRIESGMNDVILLPVVVLGMLALQSGGQAHGGEVARHAVGLLLLGPLLGGLIVSLPVSPEWRLRLPFLVAAGFSTLAWLLFLVVCVLTGIQFLLARRWVHYEGGERS